ncbi:MAG: EscU/YscU/HrcU family type III secretion system export apparatus switch protein [Proteobacteria bacterium]|nr:EscU/YscU/HrcU family type III secretion system export apparatus switch protein [Pseudomonadota bacterium]
MEDQNSGQDKTEEASPERRDEFRERGQIAISGEVTSVLVLAAVIGSFSYYISFLIGHLQHFMVAHFEHINGRSMTSKALMGFLGSVGKELLIMILPVFIATTIASCAITFAQTRMNWSWKKLEPDFSRINFFSGLVKMVSWQSLVNLLKSVGKMLIVGSVAYLILKGEWVRVPGLMRVPYLQAWHYWSHITMQLFWSVIGLLVFLASADFIYNFMTMENQMKMTKQEVKEEFKKRELDPHVKAKMKRMQRDISMSKVIQATRTATVVITNPTHFAVALNYELGMSAPIVVAKGKDLLAKSMKEIAKEMDIPIIENKPLARTLFKVCKIGQEVPESLYRAVSEVIRYVFLLKGRKINRNS